MKYFNCPMSSSLFSSFQENTKCESSFFANTCTCHVPIFFLFDARMWSSCVCNSLCVCNSSPKSEVVTGSWEAHSPDSTQHCILVEIQSRR